jgi:hypothetical protein
MLKLHEDLRIISRLQPLLGLFNFAFSPPGHLLATAGVKVLEILT